MVRLIVLVTAAITVFAGPTSAQVINEAEPNDSKATATPAVFSGPGATIIGNSIGSTGTELDYYRVTTPAGAAGIYQNRLTITSNTAGHVGTFRGLSQTATGPNSIGPGILGTADNTAQTSSATSTPPRFNQWYTFGPSADIYYRVTGVAATTADYTATYTQAPVAPVNLGSFNPGAYTFTNLGLNSTQDTEVFLFDSNLNFIKTNDDALDTANGGPAIPGGSSTLNSFMQVTLNPGTYFLAISNFNTASNQLSDAQEGTATATVLDFAGALSNSSTTLLASIPFRMSHPGGDFDFTGAKPGPYDVYFASITVVPEPTTFALCGLTAAGFAWVRKRRKAQA